MEEEEEEEGAELKQANDRRQNAKDLGDSKSGKKTHESERVDDEPSGHSPGPLARGRDERVPGRRRSRSEPDS